MKIDGEWVHKASLKADAFAVAFAKKNVLATQVPGMFTDLQQNHIHQEEPQMPGEDRAFDILRNLREGSATGPDVLPTRILRGAARELAKPLALLAYVIVSTSCWPAMWIMHWVVPLFKKKSVYDPNNYRGIHLTAQLSKAMERYIFRRSSW